MCCRVKLQPTPAGKRTSVSLDASKTPPDWMHLVFHIGQSDMRLRGHEGGARGSPGKESEEE